MKDKQLILRNFCQHRDLTINFDGMVGIVGPNGSGKSHIREALVFAKTGYLEFPKKEYITFGETFGSVTLVFVTEDDGSTYKITRNLHNGDVSVHKQTADGWDVVTGKAAAARNFAAEVIPMSADLACYMYASKQTKLTDIADATPAERAKIFSGIFSLQFLERDRKKLREILQKVDTKAADIKSRLLLLEDQLAAKRSMLQAYPTLLPQSAIDEQITVVSKRHDDVTRKLGNVNLRAFLTTEIQKYESILESCELDLLDPAPSAPCDESLADLRFQMETLKTRLANLKKAIVAIQKLNAHVDEPEVTADQVSDLNQRVGEMSAKVKALKDHYEHIVSCGTSGKCPTCGHELEYTETDLVRAQSAYMTAKQRLDELRQEWSDAEIMADKYHRSRSAKAVLESKVTDAVEPLNLSVEVSESSLTALLNDTQEELDELEATVAARAEYEKSFYEWDRKRQELLSRRASVESKLQEMRTNPVMMESEDVDVKALSEEKDKLSEKYAELQDLRVKRVQYDACRADVESFERDVLTTREALSKTQPMLREQLGEVEELLQSKKLPAKIIAALNKILTAKVNAYLTDFNAPYQIDLKANGDFVCNYSGVTISAARLSGGEKMVLSVAFRLALHSLFASDDMGGFVILDEPTTFMDETNRERLASVLELMKQSPKFKDLQIVVITHDSKMLPLFDTVVRLTK